MTADTGNRVKMGRVKVFIVIRIQEQILAFETLL